MGYADGLLTTGERVIHREKQHWWVFVWGAKFTILAVIAALLLLVLSNAVQPDPGLAATVKDILGWAALAVFIGGFALLVWTTLRYINQEYVLTNRRVIATEGVINKRSADSSLEKINDAVLTQSIFGRWFGFGDLKVLTASEAAISEFRMIQRPIEFKKAMLEAKHVYELEVAGGTPPVSPPLRAGSPGSSAPEAANPAAPVAAVSGGAPGDDTTAQRAAPMGGPPIAAAADPHDPDEVTRTLASLADLRDRGAISAEEYERKKADLLARL